MPQQETFQSINDWAVETFGRASPERTFSRAFEEWQELTDEFYQYSYFDHPIHYRSIIDHDKVLEEAADVVITLCNLPGLADVIDRKMATNRARRWQRMGDGTGYHIKETPND